MRVGRVLHGVTAVSSGIAAFITYFANQPARAQREFLLIAEQMKKRSELNGFRYPPLQMMTLLSLALIFLISVYKMTMPPAARKHMTNAQIVTHIDAQVTGIIPNKVIQNTKKNVTVDAQNTIKEITQNRNALQRMYVHEFVSRCMADALITRLNAEIADLEKMTKTLYSVLRSDKNAHAKTLVTLAEYKSKVEEWEVAGDTMHGQLNDMIAMISRLEKINESVRKKMQTLQNEVRAKNFKIGRLEMRHNNKTPNKTPTTSNNTLLAAMEMNLSTLRIERDELQHEIDALRNVQQNGIVKNLHIANLQRQLRNKNQRVKILTNTLMH
jgi:uncharacterized protein (UPF0335 family)